MTIRVAITVSAICCGLTAFSDDMPIRAVQLDLARQKEVPTFVTNYMGRVQDAENLLIDDFRGMRFGFPDCNAAFLDQDLSKRVSSVRFELRGENHQ